MRGSTFAGTCRIAASAGFNAFLASLATLGLLDVATGPMAYPAWRATFHWIGLASLPVAAGFGVAALVAARRWTVAQAGLGIAGVAIGLGTVLGASPGSFEAMRLALVAVLAISLPAAIWHRGRRAMWAGFAIFGGVFYLIYVAGDDPSTGGWPANAPRLHFQILPLVDAICPWPEGVGGGGQDREHPARDIAFRLSHASGPVILPPTRRAAGWQGYHEWHNSTAAMIRAWICLFVGAMGAANGRWLGEVAPRRSLRRPAGPPNV